MSVAMAMPIDSGYGIRIGVNNHRHIVCPSSQSNTKNNIIRDEDDQQITETPLRFSVLNILRPDFGREAILSTKSNGNEVTTRLPQPQHSPIPLPRDLSVSTANPSRDLTTSISPLDSPNSTSNLYNNNRDRDRDRERDLVSSHNSLASNSVQLHGLSRSGSLESLASNRSSLTGSSIAGTPSLSSSASSVGGESISGENTSSQSGSNGHNLWPAWVYCTRYSDRPSSGPRTRRVKRSSGGDKTVLPDEKRPRTAFSAEQLARLKQEFTENRYLTERRRQQLSRDLGLNEAQIKIWFQNKRAKIKKSTGQKNPLALQLMAQGLYNHSTVPVDEDGEELLVNEMN